MVNLIGHMAMSHLFGCMDCPRPRSHFGHGKITEMGPNGAGKFFFPANLDLADILGDMKFEFGNISRFLFLGDFKFLDARYMHDT